MLSGGEWMRCEVNGRGTEAQRYSKYSSALASSVTHSMIPT